MDVVSIVFRARISDAQHDQGRRHTEIKHQDRELLWYGEVRLSRVCCVNDVGCLPVEVGTGSFCAVGIPRESLMNPPAFADANAIGSP